MLTPGLQDSAVSSTGWLLWCPVIRLLHTLVLLLCVGVQLVLSAWETSEVHKLA